MADSPEIELDGKIYDDWQKCSFNFSISDIANSFALTTPDFTPDHGEDMAVKARFGDHELLTGWLEEVDNSTVPDQEGTRLSGRSKAGDLVDCSAIVPGGEYHNLSLLEACAGLCKPFGIGVSALVDVGDRFDRIKIEQGEEVGQVIDRICRERGLMAWSVGSGDIVLGRPGFARAQTDLRYRYTGSGQLRSDNNIIELSAKLTKANRHSKLIMRSQGQTRDDDFGIAAAQSEAAAVDDAVRRYRPKVLTSDGAGSSDQLRQRVNWEMARRIGKSTAITYQCEGWQQVPGGDIWRPGLLVAVEDQKNKIAEEMLIVSVGLTLDEDKGGYRTSLSVEPPAAWVPKPNFEKADGDAQYAALRRAVRG